MQLTRSGMVGAHCLNNLYVVSIVVLQESP